VSEQQARAFTLGLGFVITVAVAALAWGMTAVLYVIGLDVVWLIWNRARLLTDIADLRNAFDGLMWRFNALTDHLNVRVNGQVEDDSPGHEAELYSEDLRDDGERETLEVEPDPPTTEPMPVVRPSPTPRAPDLPTEPQAKVLIEHAFADVPDTVIEDVGLALALAELEDRIWTWRSTREAA
jgi:hypothetical protein